MVNSVKGLLQIDKNPPIKEVLSILTHWLSIGFFSVGWLGCLFSYPLKVYFDSLAFSPLELFSNRAFTPTDIYVQLIR